MRVRDGLPRDAAACAVIYEPYVSASAITFETEPPSAAEMARRIAAAGTTHAWVVLERDGQVRGYAYGGVLHHRPAYRWSCEVSVYVERERVRTGAGRELYTALFERLRRRGYRMAVAGMTLPNEGSAGLHRAMGFHDVGTYRQIGYKLGAWHDVAWMQRPLGSDGGDPPPEPG